MVVNPKKYQNIAAFTVVTAIELLFKATVLVGNKISKSSLSKYFSNQYDDTCVDGDQISKTVYELKRSGYIAFEGDSVKLTNKAKMKIVDQIAAQSGDSKKYHLVSFDIPETKRMGRNNFRRAIKRMGFVQIQKSLWASTRDIGDLVESAAKEYKVSDYVAYFVSETSNIDKFISKTIKKPTSNTKKSNSNDSKSS